MRKFWIYLVFYSIGGFILERIINLIAYGKYLDNSVMYGPYQPLYGLGIVLAIMIYEKRIKKNYGFFMKNFLLLIVAIATTAFSEALFGYGYEYFTGGTLWNYNEFFTCSIPYVCVVPTTLFGIFSFLVIKFVHPFVKIFIAIVPNFIERFIVLIFFIDGIITYFTKLV